MSNRTDDQKFHDAVKALGCSEGEASNKNLAILISKLDRQAVMLTEATRAQHQATLAVSNLCVAITALADAIAAPVGDDEQAPQQVERDFDGNIINPAPR